MVTCYSSRRKLIQLPNPFWQWMKWQVSQSDCPDNKDSYGLKRTNFHSSTAVSWCLITVGSLCHMAFSSFCGSASAGLYLRRQNTWVYLTGEITANVNHVSRGTSSTLWGQAKEPSISPLIWTLKWLTRVMRIKVRFLLENHARGQKRTDLGSMWFSPGPHADITGL